MGFQAVDILISIFETEASNETRYVLGGEASFGVPFIFSPACQVPKPPAHPGVSSPMVLARIYLQILVCPACHSRHLILASYSLPGMNASFKCSPMWTVAASMKGSRIPTSLVRTSASNWPLKASPGLFLLLSSEPKALNWRAQKLRRDAILLTSSVLNASLWVNC